MKHLRAPRHPARSMFSSSFKTPTSSARKRLKSLLFERLEERTVFASGVTAVSVVSSPIYEGGAAFPGSVSNSSVPPANSSWAKIQYTVTIDPADPGSSATNQKVEVRIAGDSDAFDVSNPVVKNTSLSTSTLYVGTLATSFATAGTFSFAIWALQDADSQDENLTITLTWQYQLRDSFGSVLPTVYNGLSSNGNLTIKDNEESLTLSANDATAKEPNNVFYAPEAADNGSFLFTVPSHWNGGTLLLNVAGTATYGSDYSLGLGTVTPSNPNVVFTITGTLGNGSKSASLAIPAGITSVTLLVTPLGDLIEPESSETVVVTFDPTSQTFAGSSGYTEIVSGSGTVTITDETETLTIGTNPGTVKEYAVSPDYAYYEVKPGRSGVNLLFNPAMSVYLEIIANVLNQSGKKNSAQPGNKTVPTGYTGPDPADYWLELADGTPLNLTLTDVITNTYRSTNLSANNVPMVRIRVVPINDARIEDDETIDAKLYSSGTLSSTPPNPVNPRVQQGQATVTIEEWYLRDRQEQQEQNEECSCSCTCEPGIQANVDSADGSATVSSSLLPLTVMSQGDQGQYPILMIGLPLPADKAVPTTVSASINLIEKDATTIGVGTGLGIKPVMSLASFTLDLSTQSPSRSYLPGDIVWFSAMLDLSTYNGSASTGSNRNNFGDLLLNFQVLAHATFSGAATTAQRFSGWTGYHQYAMANQASSNINNSPSAPSSGSPPPTKPTSLGPAGVNLFGTKRAIVSGYAYVSQNEDAMPMVMGQVGGSGPTVNRVGNALRYRAASTEKPTSVIFHENGAASIYVDGATPPESMSLWSSNTLTDRFGQKYLFNSLGQMTRFTYANGNQTSYFYDSAGWLSRIRDPFGSEYNLSYIAAESSATKFTYRVYVNDDRANATSTGNRFMKLIWNQTSTSVSGNSGTLTIQGIDPDGAGSRIALEERFLFTNGSLTRVERGEIGGSTLQSLALSFSAVAGAAANAPGRFLASLTRQDGAVRSFEAPIVRSQTYTLANGRILYTASTAVGGSTGKPAGSNVLRMVDDALTTAYANGLASSTDWNGNRTVYKVDFNNRIVQMWDPVQVEAIVKDLIPVGADATTWIRAMSLTDSTIAARFNSGSYNYLSYVLTRAPAIRNTWGKVTTGKNMGEVTAYTTPDPDHLTLRGGSNGPQGTQTTATSYSTEKNPISVTLPGLATQTSIFNATYSIPTQTIDENGATWNQTVDSTTGLITQVTARSKLRQGQNPNNPYDVDNDGTISPLDVLAINDYINNNGGSTPAPAGPPYYDVDGDGTVGPLDALTVINYINGGSGTPPIPVPDQRIDYTYTNTAGLPSGLIATETVYTGRTSTGQKTQYTYINDVTSNAHGKVSQITVAVGGGTNVEATTSYAYDTLGRLKTITDPAGRITTYYYDSLDRLVAVIGPDPDGTGVLLAPMTRYDYNVLGHLVAVETINSWIDTSAGNSSQLLVSSQVDSYDYNYTTNTYVTRQQRPDQITYLYLSSGNLQSTTTKATATAGSLVTNAALIAYATGNSRITNTPSSVGALQGLSVTTTTDFNGNRTSVSEQDNTNATPSSTIRRTDYKYDRLDNLIEIVEPNPGTGITTTPGDVTSSSGGYVTKITYDNLSNPMKIVDALGNQTETTYDDLNRITSQTRTTTSDPVTTSFAYQSNVIGWATTITDAEGRAITYQADLFNRPYTASGAISYESYRYWGDGQLQQFTDGVNPVLKYSYDQQGRLTQVTEDANGQLTSSSLSYSVDGLVTNSTDPMGRITQFAYDAGGRLIKTTAPDPDGAGALVASYTGQKYDALGNVMGSWTNLNDPATVTYTTANQPQRFERDARNRLIASYDETGAATRRTLDVFGNVTSVTDAAANQTNYTYNKLNRLTSETQVLTSPTAQNLTRSYSYDGVGNLRSQTDRNGRIRQFGYDQLYRVTNESWLSGGSTVQFYTYTYDKVGNLLNVNDSNAQGVKFGFAYDTRNRVQLERQTIGAGLTGATGSSVVFDRDYDWADRLTNLRANFGGTITGSSNLTPNAASPINGGLSDFQNNYTYDTSGRLRSVVQTKQAAGNTVAGKQVAFGYNAADQLTSATRYKTDVTNPVTTDVVVDSRWSYDSAGRLTSLVHAKGAISGTDVAWNGTSTLPTSTSASNILADYYLAYDAKNRLTTWASYADGFKTTYAYNSRDELTTGTSAAIAGLSAPYIPIAESYAFDATGNHTVNNVPGGTSSAASGSGNRVSNDGTYTFTYDNEGNILTKTTTSTGAKVEYTWDHRNRLTRVVNRNTSAGPIVQDIRYVYDAFDRKVGKQIDKDGNGTFDLYSAWVYDGGHAVFEFRDSDGQGSTENWRVADRFLYADKVDMVLADEQYANGTGPLLGSSTASSATGTTLWTLGDQLNSVRDVVDNNGTVRQHVVYDSMGKRLREVDRDSAGTVIASSSSSAIDELFSFTGRDWDADSKLQYNRARWYDPSTGRWQSQDPIGFLAGDTNLYVMVANAPTIYIDPNGLEKKSFWEQQAKDIIGYKPGTPHHPRDIIEMNRRITAAYAEMYLRDSNKFFWAGMAALASCDVGEGMRKAKELRNVGGSPLIGGGTILLGAPTGTELLQALGKGNLGVYADIYWQHLAYVHGGIEEMRSLAANGELSDTQLAAWEKIDSGDPWDGNRDLLLYEQQQTLQKGVYDQHKEAFANMSWLAGFYPAAFKSPIPGDNKMFTQCVPGGNLGNFDDRWKWIDSSMLPAWRALVESHPSKVKAIMEDFSKNKFQRLN